MDTYQPSHCVPSAPGVQEAVRLVAQSQDLHGRGRTKAQEMKEEEGKEEQQRRKDKASSLFGIRWSTDLV